MHACHSLPLLLPRRLPDRDLQLALRGVLALVLVLVLLRRTLALRMKCLSSVQAQKMKALPVKTTRSRLSEEVRLVRVLQQVSESVGFISTERAH